MATPRGGAESADRRPWRRIVLAVATAVLVVAAVAIGYRVLAPAEVVTPARGDYPAVPDPAPAVIGTLNAAPLIVDDRLRVYATRRTVWADRPVDARTRRTPYWAYRRWPAQVAGVVAAGTTVVTRWSDGRLVALDARTGKPRWRAAGPRPGHGYVGRRTGAATVYAPTGLLTATATDGTRVVIVVGTTERRGVDLDSGRLLWRAETDPACANGDPAGGLTTDGGYLIVSRACADVPALDVVDVATGRLAVRWRPNGEAPADGPARGGAEPAAAGLRVTPLACVVGRSRCAAIRVSVGGVDRGWLVDGPVPSAAPPLDGPETVLVDGLAVTPDGTGLVARSVSSGVERWRWDAGGPVRILATQPGRLHLRTGTGDLVTLDTATGAERSRFPLTYGRDSTVWSPGFAYAAGGFVAVERLAEPVDPSAPDGRYYLAEQPVILAAT